MCLLRLLLLRLAFIPDLLVDRLGRERLVRERLVECLVDRVVDLLRDFALLVLDVLERLRVDDRLVLDVLDRLRVDDVLDRLRVLDRLVLNVFLTGTLRVEDLRVCCLVFLCESLESTFIHLTDFPLNLAIQSLPSLPLWTLPLQSVAE